jgi:hypothetical protein
VDSTPRLSSITGVSRALMVTVGVEDAVDILIGQFGWDLAFQALAALDTDEGLTALGIALRRADELSDELPTPADDPQPAPERTRRRWGRLR